MNPAETLLEETCQLGPAMPSTCSIACGLSRVGWEKEQRAAAQPGTEWGTAASDSWEMLLVFGAEVTAAKPGVAFHGRSFGEALAASLCRCGQG